MADVAMYGADPLANVLLGQNQIQQALGRVDSNTQNTLGRLDANTQAAIGRNESNVRHDINDASANIRYENAQSEANIRRDTVDVVGNARREQAEQAGTIRRELGKDTSDVIDGVKTSAWAVSDRVGTEADRVVGQGTAYFIAAQSQNFSNATALASLKSSTDANFAATQAAIQLAAAQTAAAATLAGERTSAAAALGQALIGQQIVQDGNTTRALVNNLKMDELNRRLIERNAYIVEEREGCRHWRGQANNAQFAAVTSQLNAFASQLQETRQGITNFGTLAGVSQGATNNVA